MRFHLIVAGAIVLGSSLGCYREVEVTVFGDGISSRGPAHSMLPPWTLPPRAIGGGPHLRNDDECPVPPDDDQAGDTDDDDDDDNSILPKRSLDQPKRGHEDNI
jgi:hypothetical protein